MGRKDREFWRSTMSTELQFLDYYNRYVDMSISSIQWNGLPDTVDPRFLELALFSDGKAIFFNDEDIGYLALRCAIGGRMSVYRIPLNRRAYASNGYNKQLNENDSVIIWNNLTHTNSMTLANTYSKRLCELDKTIDVNVMAQKTPILIRCDENQRLTLQDVYMKYEGNQPVIFGSKNLNPNDVSVLTTGAPYISGELYELKTKIWNESLTYLGIPNVADEKKERMVTDEVNRGQGGTIASRFSRLEARKQAAEEINRLFGLNISVEFKNFDTPEEQSSGNRTEEEYKDE